MSIVRRYSNVADCCSCGVVAITSVVGCLAAFSMAGQARSSVPAHSLNVKSQSSKSLPSAYGSGFPTLVSSGRGFHSFCESRHCCVHCSVQRLSTNFIHSPTELLELTSRQLDFLSSCHHHSIPQVQNISAPLPCKSGKKQHKSCSSALCTVDDASYFLVLSESEWSWFEEVTCPQ